MSYRTLGRKYVSMAHEARIAYGNPMAIGKSRENMGLQDSQSWVEEETLEGRFRDVALLQTFNGHPWSSVTSRQDRAVQKIHQLRASSLRLDFDLGAYVHRVSPRWQIS